MATFKAYLKKEIIESARQYRYIVLAVGIIAFAILDPFMLKILPEILKGQIPGDISALFKTTEKMAVMNYIKDLSQIGYMFVVFSISGALSEEISSGKLIFPYSKGGSAFSIVLAKFLHYLCAIILFTFIGFFIAFYYSSILFTGDTITLKEALAAALLVSLYYFFNIALAFLFSSFTKKGITAGFLVIVINFLLIPVTKVKTIGSLMPYKLIDLANSFTFKDSFKAIIFVLLSSLIFMAITIYRMEKVEVI